MFHALKSSFGPLLLRLWKASVWALILTGAVTLAVRLLLPLAATYRDPLAREIGAALGAPVRIDQLEVRLQGLAPELRLLGLQVLDPARGEPRMQLRELRLRLDPWGTLWNGSPRIELATLVGVRLALRREADGTLSLSGGTPGEEATAPLPLLGEGHLRLLDSELLVENRRLGLAPLMISGVTADLVNEGHRHRLRLDASLPQAGRLELRADLNGTPERLQDWAGDLYIRGQGLALQAIVGPLLPPEYRVEGLAELESWARLTPDGVQELTARLELRGTSLGRAENAASPLERLAGWVQWRREADGWSLALDGWQTQGAGRTGEPAALTVRQIRVDDGRKTLYAGAERLRVEDLAALAAALPLAPGQREALTGLSPRGLVRDPRLILDWQDPPRWQASARLQGLALEPWAGVPGLGALDLELRVDQDRGQANLDGRSLELRFPGLFRWPLKAERMAGALRWQRGAEGLDLAGEDLVLENPDLRTRTRLALRLPADGGSPSIDLRTDFSDGVGANAYLYLPLGVMPPAVIDWLDRALVGGRVPEGYCVLQGRLADFPFYNRQGRFEVLFQAEDTTIDYQQGWPRLEGGRAQVKFLNEGMDIQAREARLLDSRVENTRIWIPDIKAKVSVLIDGRVQGPFADALRILRETPLAARQARYVRGMEASGASALQLKLAIPVEGVGELKVDGQLTWPDDKARLRVGDWDLDLEQLRGVLRITQQGVFADAIRAQLWGSPLDLDMTTTPALRDRPALTRVQASLPLNPKTLAKPFPDAPWGSLSGETRARLELDIEHAAPRQEEIPLGYRFQSDLTGLGVDLPAPLGKARKESRTLELAGSLPLGQEGRITGRYGDLHAGLQLTRDPGGAPRLQGLAVQAGSPAPAPPAVGVQVQGHLPRLDLAGWATRLAQNSGPRLSLPVPESRVKLTIDELDLGQLKVHQARLAATRVPQAWDLEIQSEALAGRLRWPDRSREEPVKARLETLRLQYEPGGSGPQAHPPARPLDPTQAPGVDLQIGTLYLNDHALGGLQLVARPVPEGLHLDRLHLEGPDLTFKGRGNWTGGVPRSQSRIALEAQSEDLGKTLKALKLTDAIGEARTQIKTDLHWTGGPLDFDLAQVQGSLEVQVGKGRVLDMHPGLGRILGLINLGALGRRLSLDFSDLFTAGFSFDQIEGRFRLARGNADIEHLFIQGPAAEVQVAGRAGFLARDYDQVVTVTPELSTTLPVAGALAGGPVAAAVLLVAERVVGDQVNKLIRYQYRVTGPWEDPVFTPIQTQDGWSLSNLLQPGTPAPTEQTPPPSNRAQPPAVE